MRISDWSSDVCSSDLEFWGRQHGFQPIKEPLMSPLVQEMLLKLPPRPGRRAKGDSPGGVALGARAACTWPLFASGPCRSPTRSTSPPFSFLPRSEYLRFVTVFVLSFLSLLSPFLFIT